MLIRIKEKLNDFPRQKEKLHFLAYSTLGIDIEKVNQIKFDYELAKNSLQFYQSSSVPKIEDINIPKEVSILKFVSNLVNSTPIDLSLDELLKPYVKDN